MSSAVGGFAKIDLDAVRGRLRYESPCAGKGAIFAGNCTLGAFSYVGRRSELNAAIVGRYCSIAPEVVIGPTNHPSASFSTHLFAFGNKGPFADSSEFLQIMSNAQGDLNKGQTVIGNDVWIGRRAIIKRGLTIGDGAIIGAGALVTKNVLPYEIVVGAPAKRLRMRFAEHIVSRLLDLKWWEYELSSSHLSGLDYANVEASLARFEEGIGKGVIERREARYETIDK